MLTAAVQDLCSSPPKQSCNLLTTSFKLPSLLNTSALFEVFGNTKTGELKEVNYTGAFLMRNILFKATEIASSLTQHRYSPAFFPHYFAAVF